MQGIPEVALRRAGRGAALLALLAAGAAAGACGAGAPPTRPGAPVVLVSIDTLRADRLPVYGYAAGRTPAIDALAADGVVVERAYTSYPLTLPAHATLLSGELPPRHGVRDNTGYRFDAASHPCLPERLAAEGYATGGFVSAWVLRAATGLGDCFQTYDDALGQGGSGDQRPGAATLERALAWLDGVGSKPFFLFLHLYEPHAPYAPPAPYATEIPDPYDGEIAAADAVVGSLVAELRRRGLYERTLVALVSDHGEGLGDHGELRHGVLLYQESIRVPWILKLPDGAWRGRRLDAVASLADVAPTLLASLGLAPDPASDGFALWGPGRDPEKQPVYAETWYPRLRLGWNELAALVDRRYSTILGTGAELYDLDRDPGEHHDLSADERPRVAEAVRRLRAIDSPPAAPEGAAPEEVERLAALGYLGGTAASSAGPLPDPRTRVGELSRFEEAIAADAAGDPARSARELERLLADNPQMVEALPFLARAQIHLGRLDAAEATLRRAVAHDRHPSIVLELAQLLIEKGALDEAAALAEGVRGDDPRRAYRVLLEIARRNRDERAAARWRQAALAEGVAGPGVLREQARRLAAAGHPDQASQLLEPHAADADPETLALLGLTLADSGRAAEGLAVLERARERTPRHPVVLENLGVVALQLDRTAQAREALEAAVEADPRRASAWNALGVARFRAGSPPGAVEAWQRATQLDPRLADALYNLGLVAARLGRNQVARDALSRYLAAAPDAPEEDRTQARRLLAQLGGPTR